MKSGLPIKRIGLVTLTDLSQQICRYIGHIKSWARILADGATRHIGKTGRPEHSGTSPSHHIVAAESPGFSDEKSGLRDNGSASLWLPFRYNNRRRLAKGIKVLTHPTWRLLKSPGFCASSRVKVLWSVTNVVSEEPSIYTRHFFNRMGYRQGFKVIGVVISFRRFKFPGEIFTRLEA